MITKRQELEKWLNEMSSIFRLVFALDCAQNSLKHYTFWSATEGKNWGKPEVLQDVINMIWDYIETEDFNTGRLRDMLGVVQLLTPDTEVFPTASGSGALDAACSIEFALETALNSDNLKYVIWASDSALFASDNVTDFLLQMQNMSIAQQDEFEKTRLNDASYPLAREWQRQLAVLKRLSNWKESKISRKLFYSGDG